MLLASYLAVVNLALTNIANLSVAFWWGRPVVLMALQSLQPTGMSYFTVRKLLQLEGTR